MSMSDGLRALERSLEGMIEAYEQTMLDGLREVARVAVEDYIIPRLPVDTGRTRDNARWEATTDGARIIIGTEYSSYIFAKGDELRTPIYLDLIPDSIQRASDDVDIAGLLVDVTDAYIGQGRTTAHLTGVNRKMAIHTPKNEIEAWRKFHPEAITQAEIVWNGVLQVVDLVPSDTIAAGGIGRREFSPRRRRE